MADADAPALAASVGTERARLGVASNGTASAGPARPGPAGAGADGGGQARQRSYL